MADAQRLGEAGYTEAQIAELSGAEYKHVLAFVTGATRKAPKRIPAAKPNYVDLENQEQFQIWLREAPAGDRKAYFYDKASLAAYRVASALRIRELERLEDSATQSKPRPSAEGEELRRIDMTLALCRQVLFAAEMKLVHLTQERAPEGEGWVYFVTKKPRPGVTYADTRR